MMRIQTQKSFLLTFIPTSYVWGARSLVESLPDMTAFNNREH